MNDLNEKLNKSEYIYNGKILNLRKDSVILPNGQNAQREIIELSGAAAILAINNNDEVYLVKQFRCPYKKVLTEIPAGKLNKNEDPLIAAKRELLEETGLNAKSLEPLIEFYPTPGAVDEKVYIYLAKNFEKAQQNLDPDEFLNVLTMPLATLTKNILNGTIKDAKTIIAVLAYNAMQSNNN